MAKHHVSEVLYWLCQSVLMKLADGLMMRQCPLHKTEETNCRALCGIDDPEGQTNFRSGLWTHLFELALSHLSHHSLSLPTNSCPTPTLPPPLSVGSLPLHTPPSPFPPSLAVGGWWYAETRI